MRRGRSIKRTLFCLFMVCLGGACSKQESNTAVDAAPAKGEIKLLRQNDPEQLKLGKRVFEKFCSRCHGKHAEGAKNWKKIGKDQKYPPPPLNGTGHAWHHPRHILKEIIMEGTEPDGNMPSWKSTLNEQQIEAVISWFQTLWPDELYAAWAEMDRDSQ